MSEMIDRVACALSDALADFPEMGEGRFPRLARTAIQAMREPTEAMMEAPPPIAGENPGVREIWQDMIDEALKRT